MTDDIKDLEVTIRLRNNQLKERRTRLGLTVAALAEKLKVSPAGYSQMENMRRPPMLKSGEWSTMAKKIAKFYRVDPSELFPHGVLAVADPVAVKAMSVDDMVLLRGHEAERLRLPEPDESLELAERKRMLEEAINKLTRREANVVRLRMAGHTLGEVADLERKQGLSDGCSRERIRGIESRAFAKIRHYITRGRKRGTVEIEEQTKIDKEIARLARIREAEREQNLKEWRAEQRKKHEEEQAEWQRKRQQAIAERSDELRRLARIRNAELDKERAEWQRKNEAAAEKERAEWQRQRKAIEGRTEGEWWIRQERREELAAETATAERELRRLRTVTWGDE